MPPMARNQSSKKDTSINALDDLDLDDMFEGEQNGLFDELGMELGELGDIPNDDAPVKSTRRKSQAPKGLDDIQFDLLDDIGVDDGATSSSPTNRENDSSVGLKKSKRKPKKRTRDMSASEDDDEEDESASKRKKRPSKKSKVTITKKAKADVEVQPSLTSPKSKKSKAAQGIHVIERGTSQSSLVAAAGQFGGRHKRTTGRYLPLSGAAIKSKVKGTNAGPPIAAPPLTELLPTESTSEQNQSHAQSMKRGRSQSDVLKPSDSLFCGLHSSFVFYPFMATLPPESSMKGCSKHYSMLEKINASLSASSSGTDMDDPIVTLLMLYDPVPSVNKKLTVAAAVLATRKLISGLDPQILVSDLASVSILLKRQHDFLAQSLENMEHWCKHHFSCDDYRAVYGGEKPKPVLVQLTSPLVRVRIKCAHIKETKASALLIAHIPIPTTTKPTLPHPPARSSSVINNGNSVPVTDVASSAVAATGPSKKKKRVVETCTASVPSENGHVEEHFVPYSELPPNGRRQRILDLIAKHALILETKQADIDDARRKALEKQHLNLQKVVDDDELLLINPMTLWKWADKACYFSDFSEQDVRDLLMYQPRVDDEHFLLEETYSKKTSYPVKDSLCERLQALLVDEHSDGEEDDECSDDLDDGEVSSLWESSTLGKKNEADRTMLDLSELTIEERAFVLLKTAGLMDESRPPPQTNDICEDDGDDENKVVSCEDPLAFDVLLRRMKEDLSHIDRQTNSRTAFVESSARAHLEVTRLAKRNDERSSQLISKYNHLAKKQKETKRSVRNKLPRKDEDWVPW